MSQTVQPIADAYLAAQVAPPQQLIMDPERGSIRMLTPVGRLTYVTLARPKAQTINGQTGEPKYQATILMNPNSVLDIYKAICMVANQRFPQESRPDPTNPQVMKTYTGQELLFLDKKYGGLQYPLRNGEEAYIRDPKKYAEWLGLFSINAAMNAQNANGPVVPAFLDEQRNPCDAAKFYSGCYGRLQITVYAFPKPGNTQIPNRGVAIGLNAVQFARHGDKMAGFDPLKAAREAMGDLPIEAMPDPGFGSNTAGSANIPPGVHGAPTYAAPPPQGQPPQQPPQAPAYQPPPPQGQPYQAPQQTSPYQPPAQPTQAPQYQPPQGAPPAGYAPHPNLPNASQFQPSGPVPPQAPQYQPVVPGQGPARPPGA